MTRQLRLKLSRPAAYGRDTFISGPSNRQALAALDSWPNWPGGALVLFGPSGVGKTHLARGWAEANDAVRLDAEAPDIAAAAGRPVLMDDADRAADPEALFHLINLAGRAGGGLLMTARSAPSAWPAALPDLRSRLNALFVAEIEEPDDEILQGVLRKFFRERNIRPPHDVYPYLLRRMERSIPYAREIVRRLDEAADDEQRPVSRTLARQILDDDMENLDHFD